MIFSPQPAIVYIITKLELGGAQKVCLSLFNGLQKESPVFLISGDEGLLVDEVKELPNVFLIKDLKREVSLRSILSECKALVTMTRILKDLKMQHPDLVVHTHGSKAGALGRLAAFFAGVARRIHTVHGFSFHPYLSSREWFVRYIIELLCAPLTTHYICVSKADIQIGIKQIPFFKDKHSLIRAAVNTEHFYIAARQANPFPDQSQPFVFGTIACFKAQKNIFDTLRSFQEVHEQNSLTRLEIIGDGMLRAPIEAWIAENQLQHAIVLHGWQKDVKPFLAHWHCFVLSSLWEGLPCALVEARLSKLPVVCYDTGGVRDIIYHGVNGFIYPHYDWKQLARGMLMLSSDELLFMALRHYPDNFNDFSMSSMLHRHQQLYSIL